MSVLVFWVFFFFNYRKSKVIFRGAGPWLLGGGWQGGMTEAPRSLLGIMDVFVVLVMVVGSQGFTCVTAHALTHVISVVHQLYLLKLVLKIMYRLWKDPVKNSSGCMLLSMYSWSYTIISKAVLRRIEKWIHYLVYQFSIGETLHGWGDGGSRVQPSSVIREYMGLIISIPATLGAIPSDARLGFHTTVSPHPVCRAEVASPGPLFL